MCNVVVSQLRFTAEEQRVAACSLQHGWFGRESEMKLQALPASIRPSLDVCLLCGGSSEIVGSWHSVGRGRDNDYARVGPACTRSCSRYSTASSVASEGGIKLSPEFAGAASGDGTPEVDRLNAAFVTPGSRLKLSLA